MTTTNDDTPTVALNVPLAVPPGAAPSQPHAAAGPPPPGVGDQPGRPSVKRIVAVASAAAVLVAGAAVAAYALSGDVPRGTRVLGLDIGAMSRSEAERALKDEFEPRAAEPAKVDFDGKPLAVAPDSIEMALDVDATVAQAMKGPTKLFGRRDVAPVITLDQHRLEEVLRDELDPKAVTLTKPAITYSGLTPEPTYGRAGRNLDPAAAAVSIRAVWLTPHTATVGLTQRPPVSTREDVDALIEEIAKPAVAAPVTVRVGGESITLTPAMIAKSLVFRSDATGKLGAAVDPKKLRAAAKSQLAQVEKAPESARVSLSGGKPKVVASSPGTAVDLNRLGPALLAVLGSPAPRTAEAGLVPLEAETTDEDMAALGIKQKVSTFTTHFTGGRSSPRSQNIITVAKAVDGAVVKPGETFSLNGHTGERDYAKGYQDAPVIVGGKLEPGVGGGASQFTTTLFNAAYYAGLQDVEHKPHSFYFSRYPSVIESTIFYPTLDLKFKNTTPYGILIDTSTTGSSVTVSMWSTKFYDSVKTEKSGRRNITSPPTVHREDGPKCIASSGLPGFTQDAWRIIRKDGKEIKREKFTWRYDPEPRFVCDGTEQAGH